MSPLQSCARKPQLTPRHAAANGLDKIVPASILRQAKGLALLKVSKLGFVFSARAGTGVVIARLEDGSESAFGPEGQELIV